MLVTSPINLFQCSLFFSQCVLNLSNKCIGMNRSYTVKNCRYFSFDEICNNRSSKYKMTRSETSFFLQTSENNLISKFKEEFPKVNFSNLITQCINQFFVPAKSV